MLDKSYPSFIYIHLFPLLLLFSCAKQNDKDIKIGFSQGLSNHPYRDAMNQSLAQQAVLHPDISLDIFKAQGDSLRQIRDLKKMVEDNYQVIIISPISRSACVPLLRAAKQKSIKIILLDREANTDYYDAYIGADNVDIGKQAAKYILADTNKNKEILEIEGFDNSSPTQERSDGFNSELAKNNVSVKAHLKGFEKDAFFQTLGSFTTANIYVFAFNDELASQIWEAAREKSMEKRLRIIGVDGLNIPGGGIDNVINGKEEATLLYPTGAEEAIDTALKIVRGGSVPKRIKLSTTIVNRLNVEMMRNQLDKIQNQQAIINRQVHAIKEFSKKNNSQYNALYITIILLLATLVFAAYAIYLISNIKYKNKQLILNNKKITLQRNQIENIAEQLKQSNQAKVNFFTGLSHEFKTPLTLILSSVESLRDHFNQSARNKGYELNIIQRNSHRLLRLIENLLDFRKVEDMNFNLRVIKTNIFEFISEIFNDFKKEAEKNGIRYTLDASNKDLELYIDRNLMDKVLFNLLSNAFKFTPENGEILIKIEERKNLVLIYVKDNGIGIPTNELPNVFQAYFQASNNRKNSSGIGLFLTKHFVELHLGTIEVSSNHGTEFTIKLFKGHTHFNEDQILKDLIPIEKKALYNEEHYVEEPAAAEISKKTLLLVEDNLELREFLQIKMNYEYNILVSSGSDALQIVYDHSPDIIICDGNLQGISGFEIIEILKNDLRTAHIPILLLTAIDVEAASLSGLERGADFYMAKPFDLRVLMQATRTLLFNREKLKLYYTNNIHKISNNETFQSADQIFLLKLNEIIEAHISDAGFGVEQLASMLAVSRVHLYRKVKSLLNENISDYIINKRLENAVRLLKETSDSVSDIATKCGFNSGNYFSTVFKNKFGVSPAVFRKNP